MEILREIREESIECVRKISTTAIKLDWEDPGIYAIWLAQTYYYVRHATRVLAFAAAHCSFEDEAMHQKCLLGIMEEKGHEVLVIRDLRSLGYSISQFQEFTATSAYYQTLYRNITTDGPVALIGYFVPLEGLAAIGLSKVMGIVTEKYGAKGTNFLQMHCKVDEGHFATGLDFIEAFDREKAVIFKKHLNYSTNLYINILESIIK